MQCPWFEAVAAVVACPVERVVGHAVVPCGEDEHVRRDCLGFDAEQVDAFPHRPGPIRRRPGLGVRVTDEERSDVLPRAQVVGFIEQRGPADAADAGADDLSPAPGEPVRARLPPYAMVAEGDDVEVARRGGDDRVRGIRRPLQQVSRTCGDTGQFDCRRDGPSTPGSARRRRPPARPTSSRRRRDRRQAPVRSAGAPSA